MVVEACRSLYDRMKLPQGKWTTSPGVSQTSGRKHCAMEGQPISSKATIQDTSSLDFEGMNEHAMPSVAFGSVIQATHPPLQSRSLSFHHDRVSLQGGSL